MNNYEIFLNWAKENGATLSDLSLKNMIIVNEVFIQIRIRKGKTIVVFL